MAYFSGYGASAYVALFVFSLLWPAPARGAKPDRGEAMPRRLASSSFPDRPFWIDARELVDPKGNLRKEGLDPAVAIAISNVMRQPQTNGCVAIGDSFSDYINAPRREDLEGAIRESDFVVRVRVASRSYGFELSTPGQLLRVILEEVYAGKPSRDSYYIFVPVGNFALGSVHLCKTQSSFPRAPELGEQLIAFGQTGFIVGSYLNILDERGMILIDPSGRLETPRSLRSTGPITLDGFSAEVSRIISAAQPR